MGVCSDVVMWVWVVVVLMGMREESVLFLPPSTHSVKVVELFFFSVCLSAGVGSSMITA